MKKTSVIALTPKSSNSTARKANLISILVTIAKIGPEVQGYKRYAIDFFKRLR